MPNRVHLITVPSTREGLRLAIGEAHRRYTRRLNFNNGWRGHLWQERFSSFVMDEQNLLTCLKYVENNPVRAKLVEGPEQWAWSSASAHINAENDLLVNVKPALSMVPENWNHFLSQPNNDEQIDSFRKHERTGRPLASAIFIRTLEQKLGRIVTPQKAGQKPKNK